LNKVKSWKNSKERYRWIAAALLEIEMKMRKVNNFKELDKMQKPLKKKFKNEPPRKEFQLDSNYRPRAPRRFLNSKF
jgi:hypothetical protein